MMATARGALCRFAGQTSAERANIDSTLTRLEFLVVMACVESSSPALYSARSSGNTVAGLHPAPQTNCGGSTMVFRMAADVVVLVHATFVVFVVLGGLLALRWPRMAWVHLPAAAWGAAIELVGGVCPLTPLENTLRARAGDTRYGGDFIEHYLLPVLYPAGLTHGIQVWLGALVVGVNLAIYVWVIWIRRSRGLAPDSDDPRHPT